jgi:hypothetical protein
MTTDTAAAETFHANVVGWTTAPSHWGIYFLVDSIDVAVERIEASGGKILNGPMEVPGGDQVVNAMDPQGAAFSLHARKA